MTSRAVVVAALFGCAAFLVYRGAVPLDREERSESPRALQERADAPSPATRPAQRGPVPPPAATRVGQRLLARFEKELAAPRLRHDAPRLTSGPRGYQADLVMTWPRPSRPPPRPLDGGVSMVHGNWLGERLGFDEESPSIALDERGPWDALRSPQVARVAAGSLHPSTSRHRGETYVESSRRILRQVDDLAWTPTVDPPSGRELLLQAELGLRRFDVERHDLQVSGLRASITPSVEADLTQRMADRMRSALRDLRSVPELFRPYADLYRVSGWYRGVEHPDLAEVLELIEGTEDRLVRAHAWSFVARRPDLVAQATRAQLARLERADLDDPVIDGPRIATAAMMAWVGLDEPRIAARWRERLWSWTEEACPEFVWGVAPPESWHHRCRMRRAQDADVGGWLVHHGAATPNTVWEVLTARAYTCLARGTGDAPDDADGGHDLVASMLLSWSPDGEPQLEGSPATFVACMEQDARRVTEPVPRLGFELSVHAVR